MAALAPRQAFGIPAFQHAFWDMPPWGGGHVLFATGDFQPPVSSQWPHGGLPFASNGGEVGVSNVND